MSHEFRVGDVVRHPYNNTDVFLTVQEIYGDYLLGPMIHLTREGKLLGFNYPSSVPIEDTEVIYRPPTEGDKCT